jgi:hypothetical protein
MSISKIHVGFKETLKHEETEDTQRKSKGTLLKPLCDFVFLRGLRGLMCFYCLTSFLLISVVSHAAGAQPEEPARPGLTVQAPRDEFLVNAPVGRSYPIKRKPQSLLASPDLDVQYIQRTPAYPYDGEKKWPDPGESVTFTGHIANRGGSASGAFAYRWSLDGVDEPLQNHPGLGPGEQAPLSLSWTWTEGAHTVRLTLDPADAIPEFSENNNSVEDRTNALELGIYVEQSVYDFFNENLWRAGWGGNSFDDWLQRNVAIWNGRFANAIHPLTPKGVIDRVRLGKVVRVPDGGNHCSTNFPADDRELDLIWGFISESVGVPSDPGCPGWTAYYRDNPSTWELDPGLLHELTHARYLIDLYALNIDAHTNNLTAAVGLADVVIPLTELPDIPEYATPIYLIIEGEIIVCNGKDGLNATDCQRGQYGTFPRAHAEGAAVFADKVLLQDGKGDALAGGQALPLIHYSFFYREPYFEEDMMDSGSGISEHTAYAWNRIAGQRPKCGNANAPCNLGEYLVEIPSQNILRLTWSDQSLAANVRVEVYQAKPFPIWYGTSYEVNPDFVLRSDASGKVNLGGNPFRDPIVMTYGHTNTVILLKVIGQGKLGTLFFDISQANIAYWSGNHDSATYPLTISNFSETDFDYTWEYLPLVAKK